MDGLCFKYCQLTHAEKDALITVLLKRIEALEALLNTPPKTPGNASLPPSQDDKANKDKTQGPKETQGKRAGVRAYACSGRAS